MIKITESEEKITPAKKSIKLDRIFVKDLKFVDEEGNIAERVAGLLVNPSDCFKVTIKIELPDEDAE